MIIIGVEDISLAGVTTNSFLDFISGIVVENIHQICNITGIVVMFALDRTTVSIIDVISLFRVGRKQIHGIRRNHFKFPTGGHVFFVPNQTGVRIDPGIDLRFLISHPVFARDVLEQRNILQDCKAAQKLCIIPIDIPGQHFRTQIFIDHRKVQRLQFAVILFVPEGTGRFAVIIDIRFFVMPPGKVFSLKLGIDLCVRVQNSLFPSGKAIGSRGFGGNLRLSAAFMRRYPVYGLLIQERFDPIQQFLIVFLLQKPDVFCIFFIQIQLFLRFSVNFPTAGAQAQRHDANQRKGNPFFHKEPTFCFYMRRSLIRSILSTR